MLIQFRFTLIFVLFICCFNIHATPHDTRFRLKQQISRLAPHGCVILHDENGRELFSYNPDNVLIPASIIKILTSIVAIELLGEDFKFKTQFFRNQNGDLAIKGWGDPFLISEELDLIARALKTKGLTKINAVFLDDSAFSIGFTVPGTSQTLNPYDALNGALVVNFNTLMIGKNRKGAVYSAEKHTPLTPLAIIKGRQLKAGTEERINLTDKPKESLQYTGELFTAFLQKQNISVLGKEIKQTIVDNSWNLFYTHYGSRSLHLIFEGLMKYSNNFIANQIFLVTGGEKTGYPATLEKSQQVFKAYVKNKWNMTSDQILVDEASGISTRNRMTGTTMMRIMEHFRTNGFLLAKKKGVRVKSGTLTGVYNYAGYFETNQGLRPFVIMTNQRKNYRDKILLLLKQHSLLTNTKPQVKPNQELN